MPIETIESLRSHIELAIRVELSTIPPYLFAMYSIEDHGSEASSLIRSIVAEEMLHAALATNLLLAVGGTPSYGDRSYLPTYPMDLPHHKPPLALELAPCSMETIRDVFMRIEQPELHDSPPEPDDYESLGQFYHALEVGLEELSGRLDLFQNPQIESQMGNPTYYRPVTFDTEDSGGLLLIYDLVTAIDAIEIIIHQGEGLSEDRWADPTHQELTHFHKLVQIYEGESPLGRVVPVRRNPTTAGYPEEIRVVSDLFNALYRGVYLTLDQIFRGGAEQHRAVGLLYVVMGDLMSRTARFLVEQELEDGTFAAPTFEYFEFSGPSAVDVVRSLADRAATHFPDMMSVRDGIEGLSLIF
ncbi:MAG TPA: ferritin-like protein [Acidimicrobiia bacterium]|nr:ferritin-like protein [Acidimicrobiia bacterium]